MVENTGLAADGEKKHTKNLNSLRPIPIHSTLANIGFLDLVAHRQQDKTDPGLFKLNRDNQGRLAKNVANWFSRYGIRAQWITRGYIERRGVLSKGVDEETGMKWSKSYHSFRHTVIDNLRGKTMRNGEYIREQDIALVVVHEKTSSKPQITAPTARNSNFAETSSKLLNMMVLSLKA